jgi:hemoglobin-like flavoprotein
MHASQVALVQTTFDQVLPISDVIADVFYGRLFHLDPSMRRLFHGDPKLQGKKLLDAVSIIIGNLNRPDRILPGIRALGRRHVAYGVQSQHYTTFGEALIWTLEHGLGDAFTTEVRRAWTAVYNLLAATMKDAAETLEAVPAH